MSAKPGLGPSPVEVKAAQKKLAALTEGERRKHRGCFAGHRPDKLKRPVDDVKVDLENAIMAAIDEGYTTFITGMCWGVDIWAGEIVNRLKNQYEGIKLIAAVPYPEFAEGWSPDWQNKYKRLLHNADAVKVLSREYNEAVFQMRNTWMVDHSAKLIAVSNGQKSGTQNTIWYARKQNVSVTTIKA